MSTNWIIGIVIGAIVVLGGGYYVMSSGSLSMSDKTPTGSSTAREDQYAKATGVAFAGSWNDLVARGGNYKCDINHMGTNDTTTGTVYISGTSLRGDFSSDTKAGVIASHMLKISDTMYVWGDAMKQGVMMKATAMQGSSASATQGAGVSQDQSYDWSCSATGAEASMFVKPSNIDFLDVSVMMKSSIPAGMMPSTKTPGTNY